MHERITTPFSCSSAVAAGDFAVLGLHRGFGDTFPEQLKNTFACLQETLGKLGWGLKDLIKVNVWLKNIKDLPAMEKRFTKYFPENEYPARMTATTLFIDADCLLMIDGIAHRNS